MYRPERVQFYCIAASGPQLAALNDLPHVAAVAALHDTEGVTRLLATVRGIVEERERLFASRGLDMEQVREAKFGPHPTDIGVAGGDVVLVRSEEHTSELQSLMRISYAVFCLKKKKIH